MKKKILILNWRDPLDPKSGGAEKVTLKHALRWVEEDHQVFWLSGKYAGAAEHSFDQGINFYRIGSSQTLFLRAAFIYWFKFRGDFDVVVDEVHGIPAFTPLWAFKSKKIVLIHELAGDIWNEMFGGVIGAIGRFIENSIFPFVYQKTKFWVDGKSTRDDLINIGISKKHIVIIPCAIDKVPSVKVDKEKSLTILFIARLVPMKGLHHALEVFKEILKINERAKFYVVGDGDSNYINENKLKAKNISNQIKFWGHVTDKKKYELLAKSHFLLHTSIKEGFGLTVLEANSQHTPAAVFRVSALKDLVEDNKTGVVAAYKDYAKLAKKITTLYVNQSKYSQMSKESYLFSKSFVWSKFTKQSLQLLESL